MAKSISRRLADSASPTGAIDGTLSTAAQTNITSVGTLSALTVSGALAANGGAVFNEAGNDIDFRVESDGNANMLFVDGGTNNVGLGLVPTSFANRTSLDIGLGGKIWGHTAATETGHGSNFYFDGAYKRIAAVAPTRHIQDGNGHTFSVAASGAADSTITWDDTLIVSPSGNVGIGTNNPAAALEVARGSAGYVGIFGAPQGLGKVILFKDNHASPNKYNWLVGTQYNTDNAFEITPSTVVGGYTFNAPAITVLETGNVGIGTSNINALLHVGGTAETQGSQANPAIQIGSTTGYRLGMYTDAEAGYIENKNGDDGLNFKVKTAGQAMRIDGGTGNVGIGTTSPTGKLEIQGTHIGSGVVDVDYFKALKLSIPDNTEWGGQAQFSVGRWEENGNNARSSLVISLGHNQQNSDSNADTDVMTLLSSGNVGIGTTSPTSRLTVSGQLTGGLGAIGTGGTLDWNHSTNARSGMGYSLLLGSATNGPGGGSYYHVVNYEYTSKNGSGNMTQFAISYYGYVQYTRYRYQGTWSSWGTV